MAYTLIQHFVTLHVEDYIRDYRDEKKFIAFCRECNRYNRCWACPPYDFDTTAQIGSYKYIHILGTQIMIDPQSNSEYPTDEARKTAIYHLLEEVRSQIDPQLRHLESKYPGSLAFYAGTCHLCPNATATCTRITSTPCRHPSLIRHSLESFGFDLGRTASELLHLPLLWSDGEKLPGYLLLISGLFTSSEITQNSLLSSH